MIGLGCDPGAVTAVVAVDFGCAGRPRLIARAAIGRRDPARLPPWSDKSIPDPNYANVTKVLLLTSGGYLREAGATWKTEHNASLAVERFERRWRNGECRNRAFTIAALSHLDK